MNPIAMTSVIQRRLLVNYRVDPAVAARQLPPGFRPQLVRGWAVAGICLLRLGRVRPTALPSGGWGLTSENAAHRYAVEWDTPDGPATGVFIARRDSGSRLNVLAGGRVFPGRHHRAGFEVSETDHELHIRYATTDRRVRVEVTGTIQTGDWWQGSELFGTFAEASEFFRRGHDGYSPARDGGFDGMRLRCDRWQARPVAIEHAMSSVYDAYPSAAATLDCALVITEVPAQWEALPPLSGGRGR